MSRKTVLLLVFFTLGLSFSGCWDYHELETVDFVLGLGLDEIDPDFDLVVETIKVKGTPETEFTPVVFTNKGPSLSATRRALTDQVGARLIWSHAQVMLFSEEVAQDNILAALEFVVRDADIRTSMLLFVTKDCTVEEVFKSKPPIADIVSDHLVNLVSLRGQIPNFYPRRSWQFQQALSLSGINPTLPTVKLVQEGTDKIPVIDGTALFKGTKMVGWIDGQESRLLAMIMGERDRGALVVRTNVGGRSGDITYEVRSNKVKVSPKVDGPKLAFSIEVQLQLDLSELGALDIEYGDPKVRLALEKEINNLLQGQILECVEKIQKEFKTDVLGLGLTLKQRHPSVWRLYEGKWDEVFPEVEVEVAVGSRIVSTGVLSRPGRMRE